MNKAHQDLDRYAGFSRRFLEQVLGLLWRRWRQLGVGGSSRAEQNAMVLDPEVMLLLTWEFGRFDPRLFDEVLRWCCYWGELIDIARLSALLKGVQDRELYQVVGAFAHVVSDKGKRGWKSLVKKAEDGPAETTALFLTHESAKEFQFGVGDSIFESYGLLRGTFTLRGKPVADSRIASSNQLRFRLRRLFGVGVRSEALVMLLTHEQTTPREVALASGYTSRGVSQALQELGSSGLVVVHELPGQKRRYPMKTYSLDHRRWWTFLNPENPGSKEDWENWVQVFLALHAMWKRLRLLSKGGLSSYKVRSRLAEGMREVQDYLGHTSLRELSVPALQVQEDDFFGRLERYWEEVFALLCVETSLVSYLFLDAREHCWPVVFGLPLGVSVGEVLASEQGRWLEIRASNAAKPPLPKSEYMPFWIVREGWIDPETGQLRESARTEARARDTYWLKLEQEHKGERIGEVHWYDQAVFYLSDGQIHSPKLEEYLRMPPDFRASRLIHALALMPLEAGVNKALDEGVTILFDDSDALWTIAEVEQNRQKSRVRLMCYKKNEES